MNKNHGSLKKQKEGEGCLGKFVKAMKIMQECLLERGVLKIIRFLLLHDGRCLSN